MRSERIRYVMMQKAGYTWIAGPVITILGSTIQVRRSWLMLDVEYSPCLWSV